MTFKMVDGKFLMVGGKFVVNTSCCCGEEFCIGCSGTADLTDLTVDIDASAATANGGAIINGCDDAACQDISGMYTVSYFAGGSISACVVTFSPSNICYWELPLSETSPTIACVTNTLGGPIYLYFRVAVGLASDGDWYIVANVIFSDDPVTPSGTTYIWQRNLGSSKPTCGSVFPITLDSGDYCSPIGFGEVVTATCHLSSISLTIDIA